MRTKKKRIFLDCICAEMMLQGSFQEVMGTLKYHQHSLWSDIPVLGRKKKKKKKNKNISIGSLTTEKNPTTTPILKIMSVLILWAKKQIVLVS